MQTTLARRQRHRRALEPSAGWAWRNDHRPHRPHRRHRHHPRHRHARRGGGVVHRGRVQLLRPGPARPEVGRSTTSQFEQQTIVYDRTGKVELARLGTLKREVVGFDTIPPETLDATTAIEDQYFWTTRASTRPPSSAPGSTRSSGRPRGASTITQQLVRARLLPAEAFAGLDLRAQDPRDHPVDPPDRGLSRATRASRRSSPPT